MEPPKLVKYTTLRVPLEGYEQELPEKYKSQQKKINRKYDMNDEEIKRLTEEMKLKGLTIVNPDDNKLYDYRGSRIAYIRKYRETGDLKFRSGGFLTNVYEEYLQYKAFNGAVFHINKNELHVLWVNVPIKKTKDLRVIIDRPEDSESKYKLYMKQDPDDPDSPEELVKVFRDAYIMERFKATDKYRRMLSYGFIFRE